MHFIQWKHFSEKNITSHALELFQIWIFFLNLPRVTDNAVAGHMRPASLYLEHTGLDYSLWHFLKIPTEH